MKMDEGRYRMTISMDETNFDENWWRLIHDDDFKGWMTTLMQIDKGWYRMTISMDKWPFLWKLDKPQDENNCRDKILVVNKPLEWNKFSLSENFSKY